MVIALSRYTGWSLTELLELTEQELELWFEASVEFKRGSEGG